MGDQGDHAHRARSGDTNGDTSGYRGYRTIYPPPLTISTFCHFRENCIFGDLKFARNFNVLQFQSARGARRRKNVLQFQRVCNFYISKISGVQQFPCCCNFYIQRSTGCMQFQRITISTRARSAQAKIVHLVCLYKAETTSRPPQARKK